MQTIVSVPKQVSADEENLLRQLAEIQGDEVAEKGIWQKLFGG